MSLEIKVNDSFVPFEFAPNSVKIDLEWALMNANIADIKVTSTKKESVKGVCNICLLPHTGLYCTNCLTGERVRLSDKKFVSVMKLTPIN